VYLPTVIITVPGQSQRQLRITAYFYVDAAVADDSLNDSLSMPDGSADVSGTSHKDELADILSPNFNLESMVSQTGRLTVLTLALCLPTFGTGLNSCLVFWVNAAHSHCS
jgi:hypothetical protein